MRYCTATSPSLFYLSYTYIYACAIPAFSYGTKFDSSVGPSMYSNRARRLTLLGRASPFGQHGTNLID